MADRLDWMFELDGDTSGADRLLKTLDRLDKTMNGLDKKVDATGEASKKAGDGHRAHGREAEKLGGIMGHLKETVDHATEGFGHMIEVVGEWRIAEWILELPRKLFEIGEDAIKTAAKAERMRSAFGFLFGEEEGDNQYESSDRIAQHSEFSTHRLQELTANLANAGFKGHDLDAARAAANDIAALNPNKEAGLGEAESALERIRETGRINRRAFVGMHLDADAFYKDLSQSTGKGLKQVEKEVEQGSIKIDTVLNTLFRQVAKKTGETELGSTAEKMSKGLDATLMHLGELPERYFERLSKSRGFDNIKDALAGLLEKLDPDSPDGKRIFGALEETFDALGSIVKSIDLAGIIESATDALAQFERGLLVVMSHLPGERGTKASVELYNFDKRQDARKLKAAEDAEFKKRAEEHGTTDVFERAASDAKTGFYEAGKQAAAGYAGGLSDSERVAIEGAYSVSDKSLEAMRDALGIRSPSRKFAELGEASGDGYTIGLKKSLRETSDAVSLPFRDSAPAPNPLDLGMIGRGSGRAPIMVSVHAPVSISGAGRDAEAIAEEVGRRLPEILPGALTSALEQFAIEGGS